MEELPSCLRNDLAKTGSAQIEVGQKLGRSQKYYPATLLGTSADGTSRICIEVNLDLSTAQAAPAISSVQQHPLFLGQGQEPHDVANSSIRPVPPGDRHIKDGSTCTPGMPLEVLLRGSWRPAVVASSTQGMLSVLDAGKL
jgi:hypothetical protein